MIVPQMTQAETSSPCRSSRAESLIKHPTDSGPLVRGITKVAGLAARIQDAGIAPPRGQERLSCRHDMAAQRLVRSFWGSRRLGRSLPGGWASLDRLAAARSKARFRVVWAAVSQMNRQWNGGASRMGTSAISGRM
jgi:hypothetical protein